MKILILPHRYYPDIGGVQVLSKHLAEALVAKGHQVSIIIGNHHRYDQFIEDKVRPKKEIVKGVNIIRLPYGGFIHRLGIWLGKLKRPYRVNKFIRMNLLILKQRLFEPTLFQAISEFNPDIVMALPHAYYNVQAAQKYCIKNKIVFTHMPLISNATFNGKAEEAMWKIMHQADAVLVCTESEFDIVSRDYHIPKRKIFITSVGTHLPQKDNQFEEKKRVLFLGRKIAYKGISNLIKAMHIVWERYPETKLTIAGVGKMKDINNGFNEMTLTSNKDRIEEFSDIDEELKSKLLLSSECLVLPSKGEAFGLVLLEAWAHNLPVVALDLSVFRSIVDAEQDGLLTIPEDIQDLANKIERLMENRDFAHKLGMNGRKKVEERYVWEKVVERYISVFESVLNAKRKRS